MFAYLPTPVYKSLFTLCSLREVRAVKMLETSEAEDGVFQRLSLIVISRT